MPDRIADDRSLLFTERQIQSHRLQRQQDVRKNNGGIQRKPFNGLKGHLRGQFRDFTNIQDAMILPNPLIFLHVSTGLTHKPDRRPVHGFPAAGFEKSIIAHKGRDCKEAQKALSMRTWP